MTIESTTRNAPRSEAPSSSTPIQYPEPIETEIARLQAAVEQVAEIAATYPARWLALQLLEGDAGLVREVGEASGGQAVLDALAGSRSRLEQHYGEEVDVILAEFRYDYAHRMVQEVLARKSPHRLVASDRVDAVVTHRFLGVPIFLGLMWVMFKVTTEVAAPYQAWVEGLFSGPFTHWVISGLTFLGWQGTWLESLLVDGIIAGVGGVLIFVPVLMALYMVLGLLEDSGYMARAAFVMDELMHVIGLHGKSFLPMVIGFGCTVPALYATRTLDNRRDRILTGLLVPFMSCSARLPVYIMIASIFFPSQRGLVIFGLYLLGVVVAIGLGLFFKHFISHDTGDSALVIELPPYRLPTLGGIWYYMWSRISGFLHNATTVVLAASCLIWLLMAVPTTAEGRFAQTGAGQNVFAGVARVVAPALRPLGFGSWEAAGSLVSGFVAKEVVVSTMAQVTAVERFSSLSAPEPEPRSSLLQDLGFIASSFGSATIRTIKSIPSIVGISLAEPEDAAVVSGGLAASLKATFDRTSGGHGRLAALAFMAFVLLYTPCVASLAVERQELGTRWMWASIVGQLTLAWLAALVIFQGGRLLGLG